MLAMHFMNKNRNDYCFWDFQIGLNIPKTYTEYKIDRQQRCDHQSAICHLFCLQGYNPISKSLLEAALERIISLTTGFNVR